MNLIRFILREDEEVDKCYIISAERVVIWSKPIANFIAQFYWLLYMLQ